MQAIVPTHRAVIGEDLDALREQLGLSVSDACWLYGLSMTKWWMIARRDSSERVSKASLALLVRVLSSYPQLCPVPKSPRPHEVFDLIKKHLDGLDKKRMSIMFGCEASSGYRWLTLDSKVSPIQSRLFSVFVKLFEPAAKQSPAAAMRVLQSWDRMVANEGLQRGVVDIFSSGRWNPKGNPQTFKPVTGNDVDELRERLGLSTMDACYLFGMSMPKWMSIVKSNGSKPLRNATLSLLVRSLQEHPEACPIARPPTAQQVFSAIAQNLPTIDKKRMAIMFGCEASSGYRWLKLRSKIGPALQRLFRVFLALYEPAHAVSSSRAIQVLEEWNAVVEIEAKARDVENVFSTGRWVLPGEKGDTGDEDGDEDFAGAEGMDDDDDVDEAPAPKAAKPTAAKKASAAAAVKKADRPVKAKAPASKASAKAAIKTPRKVAVKPPAKAARKSASLAKQPA